MNKYNEIKLNKTKQDIKKQCCLLCTLRKGLAESWKALSSSPVCSGGGDCLDIQDRDLCDRSGRSCSSLPQGAPYQMS